jgi:hypothetical protein
MTTQPPVMTAENLWQLPAEGGRYELVRGTLQRMAPVGSDQGAIVMNIAGPLLCELFLKTTAVSSPSCTRESSLAQ